LVATWRQVTAKASQHQGRHAGVVALVLLESVGRVFSDDAFFPAVVAGMHRELDRTDHQLMITVADDAASRTKIEQYARSHRVDAVVFASAHGADPLPGRLASRGVPVVCSGRPLGRAKLPYVDVAHRDGVEAALAYLLDHGRSHIATIAGPRDMVAGRERLAGYHSAMRRAGLPAVVEEGDFTRESGAVAMRRLLEQNPDLDAVFVASDLMAHGAVVALQDSGRRVPDDVAVIGFDDLDTAQHVQPALTTIRQPVDLVGQRLAHQAVRLIADDQIELQVILPTRLVVRESA
jgi:DNA-binding LacI/PurR family transcriptional regulator